MIKIVKKLIVQYSKFFTMTLLLTTTSAYASDNYYFTSTLQNLNSSYDIASAKESLNGQGVLLSINYLEQWGISAGFNHTAVNFRSEATDVSQKEWFASLHTTFFKNSPGGQVTGQLNFYQIDNNDPTGNSDNVQTIGIQVSHLNADSSLYLGSGLSQSSYPQDLEVWQWTPTIGFSLPLAAQWLRLRGYLIKPNKAYLAQSSPLTFALDSQWTYWFNPHETLFSPTYIQLAALLGKRIYTVDNDAYTVYNHTALQTGGMTLTLAWQLTENTLLLINGGQSNYTEETQTDSQTSDATSHHLYLSLSKSW